MEAQPIRYIGMEIEVEFDVPPAREKTPPCPDGFFCEGEHFRVVERLMEWSDFSRKGRSARNMQPAHAAVAAGRGSLGVGRFFFRVRTDTSQVFDLYYDRNIISASDRKGHWFLYREMSG